MEQGRVKTHVYSEYIRAASKTGFSLFLAAIVAQQASSVLGNLVLRSWGEHNREMGSNAGMLKYLIIYGAASLSSILLGGAAAILMWVLCSLRSAKRLHDAVSYSVIPMNIESEDSRTFHRCWSLSCMHRLASLS